ncbi:unnamed protein product, partial [Schistosoma turkestanicum]
MSKMSHKHATTPVSTDNSALDPVEAAKAKQNSLRERLAARRQLLASVTHFTKTSSSTTLLPTNISTEIGPLGKPFSANQSTVFIIENALKRKHIDSNITSVSSDSRSVYTQSHITSLSGLFNPSISIIDDIGKCSRNKSQNASADFNQPNNSCNLPDNSSDIEKSKLGQSSVQLLKTSHQHIIHTSLCSETMLVDRDQNSMFSDTKKQCRDDELMPDINRRILCDKSSKRQNVIKDTSQKMELDLENLLGAETTREKESKRIREEVMELLNRQSTKV